MRVSEIILEETPLSAFPKAQAGEIVFSPRLFCCFIRRNGINQVLQLGNSTCFPTLSFFKGFSTFYTSMYARSGFCAKWELSGALVHKLCRLVHRKVKTLSINEEVISLRKTGQLPLKERSGSIRRRLAGKFRVASSAPLFEKLLLNTDLCFIDKRGQLPITELPGLYNQYLSDFLQSYNYGN